MSGVRFQETENVGSESTPQAAAVPELLRALIESNRVLSAMPATGDIVRAICANDVAIATASAGQASHALTPAVHESLWDWQRRYASSVENPYNKALLREVAQNYQYCVARIEELEREAKAEGRS